MRKPYTVNLDTETWEMLNKLAQAFGVSRSRVLDMAVFHYHECTPDQTTGECKGCKGPPQRNIQLGPEEE